MHSKPEQLANALWVHQGGTQEGSESQASTPDKESQGDGEDGAEGPAPKRATDANATAEEVMIPRLLAHGHLSEHLRYRLVTAWMHLLYHLAFNHSLPLMLLPAANCQLWKLRAQSE